jgi:hypothetical protein
VLALFDAAPSCAVRSVTAAESAPSPSAPAAGAALVPVTTLAPVTALVAAKAPRLGGRLEHLFLCSGQCTRAHAALQ